MKSLPLWEILIPTANNDGSIFNRIVHEAWEDFAVKLTGGLSQLTPIKGVWTDKGKTYREEMLPYRVRCDEETIERLVRFAGRHYEQLAMMFYAVSNDCRIVEVR